MTLSQKSVHEENTTFNPSDPEDKAVKAAGPELFHFHDLRDIIRSDLCYYAGKSQVVSVKPLYILQQPLQ